MHVLDRPHLPRAVAVTLIAGVLAIILTLAVASSLGDHGVSLAPSSAPRTAPALRASVTHPHASTIAFTRSPFASLLTAPVTLPWAQASR